MRFKKRPIVVDAFRLGIDQWPRWFEQAAREFDRVAKNGMPIEFNMVEVHHPADSLLYAFVHTQHGAQLARRGSWIVRDARGDMRVVRASAFDADYELAGADDEQEVA